MAVAATAWEQGREKTPQEGKEKGRCARLSVLAQERGALRGHASQPSGGGRGMSATYVCMVGRPADDADASQRRMHRRRAAFVEAFAPRSGRPIQVTAAAAAAAAAGEGGAERGWSSALFPQKYRRTATRDPHQLNKNSEERDSRKDGASRASLAWRGCSGPGSIGPTAGPASGTRLRPPHRAPARLAELARAHPEKAGKRGCGEGRGRERRARPTRRAAALIYIALLQLRAYDVLGEYVAVGPDRVSSSGRPTQNLKPNRASAASPPHHPPLTRRAPRQRTHERPNAPSWSASNVHLERPPPPRSRSEALHGSRR
eukprot:336594-Chlamydomonas_euryale.AAC.4